MGNCVSESVHKDFIKGLRRGASSDRKIANGGGCPSHHEDDITSFRVYIHRRNKFIHVCFADVVSNAYKGPRPIEATIAWLRVSPSSITMERSKTDSITWPLQYLRRYGYTSAGIFFFESGRRCPGGEGLHTFQSHSAEAIFLLVQSRIQDSANASAQESMRFERARSVGASAATTTRASFSVNTSNTVTGAPRIHPLQRYSSEGAGSSGDYQPAGYSSFQAPPPARTGLGERRTPLQSATRPRSVGDAEAEASDGDDRTIRAGSVCSTGQLSSDSFHPMRNRSSTTNAKGNGGIVGNIMSENRVHGFGNSAVSLDLQQPLTRALRGQQAATRMAGGRDAAESNSIPYANVTSSSARSTYCKPPQYPQGQTGSAPPTPTRTVFPIQWDGGAGSTSFLCYANTLPSLPAAPLPKRGGIVGGTEGTERYVNVHETRHYETPPPQLNYASVEPPSEGYEFPSRSNSMSQQRSELGAATRAVSERPKASPAPLATVDDDEESQISYTQIDRLRTQALREASEQSDQERRRGRSRPLVVE